ncbi:hypothetical protein JCGZ_06383 [Jatropha curcas]|uniref:Uncharacterized protein n=1 Tax=Jatropha curcas TaxID=180498 RepID=A0A067KNS2_JATCU|nr:hypothetical protein JCGZ_06383 [Jatropha curcas]
MHSWTRSLSKVEKINLGRYGLSPVITLRGVVIDWDFLRACIKLWDPEAHVFRFGAMMEEMCPLFEEFYAIIGCDPNAPLVKHEVKIGYVRSFKNLFQFSRPQARAMIVEDQKAILLPLIDEFSEACPNDPDRMRLRMRALVSFRHTRVYLLGFTHCTWYCASCVLRQMGIDQTVPTMDDISADSAITPGVTRAVLRAWVRDRHMVRPLPNPASIQTSPEYRTWFIATVWPIERPRRTTLLSALEGWVQADADDEVGTGEEIVLAPRTGESLTARDDLEDVAPRRRWDT